MRAMSDPDPIIGRDHASPAAAASPRRRRSWAIVAVLCTAAAAVGLWGVSAGRHAARSEPAAVGAVVAAPGGELRVDDIVAWEDGGPTMPGMGLPDPVPAGRRRFWIYVTMKARDGGPGMRYERSGFAVAGDGLAPIAPHAADDHLGTIRPGAIATAILLFEVPTRTRDLRLEVRGARPIGLPPGPAPTTTTTHH
jgi:hypothetical protein